MSENQSPSTPTNPKHRWPEGAIVYHIYPRSLQDTNNDGVGDLQGIITRLDYLQDLGVNAIWLSPFYPSPMADFGYDISDYCNVDPIFGTLDDFKQMLDAAHDHNIKVMVDLVANHTSDAHPWFIESRSSRDNPKHDWYIWRNPRIDPVTRERQTPNNWREALAGGTAWEWDETRGQYYMHSWHKRQPDLNWSNKKVRHAIKAVMRFWLDLGVDGFRADAVDWIAKDPLFRDDDPNPDYSEEEDSPYDALKHNNSRGWPTEYAYLAEMTSVFEEQTYKDRQLFMVAETYQERHNPADAYVAFYGGIDPELAAPFNFEGLYLGWDANAWRRFLKSFHAGLKGINQYCVPSYAFGNHDNPRMVSRLGESAARGAALMQLTLPGMIFIYYGEEIGLPNVDLPHAVMHDAYYRSRDPERTPMQWSDDKNAGFSDADSTWLPVSPDFGFRNVELQKQDKKSFFNLYRKLMHLRNESAALRYGAIEIIETNHPDVLGFVRTSENEHAMVLVNFADRPALCAPDFSGGELLLSSDPQTELADAGNGVEGHIQLLPHEAALFVKQR